MSFDSLLRKCIFAVLLYSVSIALWGYGYPVKGLNGASLPLYPSVTGTGMRDGFINQASLAYNNDLTAGFSYYSRFGVHELAIKSLYLTLPHGNGSLGFRYDNYGFEQLMYHSFSAAGGLMVSEILALGVEAGISASATPVENARLVAATCQAGMILSVSESTSMGLHLVNPIPNSLRNNTLPSSIRAGAGTMVNDRLTLTVLFEKSSHHPLSMSAGFSYFVTESTGVKAGYSTATNSLGFTLICRFGKLEPELSFLTHNRLGVSSVASVFRRFRR